MLLKIDGCVILKRIAREKLEPLPDGTYGEITTVLCTRVLQLVCPVNLNRLLDYYRRLLPYGYSTI